MPVTNHRSPALEIASADHRKRQRDLRRAQRLDTVASEAGRVVRIRATFEQWERALAQLEDSTAAVASGAGQGDFDLILRAYKRATERLAAAAGSEATVLTAVNDA